jgi:hypothetical protein
MEVILPEAARLSLRSPNLARRDARGLPEAAAEMRGAPEPACGRHVTRLRVGAFRIHQQCIGLGQLLIPDLGSHPPETGKHPVQSRT